MTYASSERRISAGFGTRRVADWRRLSSFSSLSRMPLQTLMQLSQMYTPGPAMSLRTSAWLLPQKEHMVRFEARAIEENYAGAWVVRSTDNTLLSDEKREC